MAPFGLNYFPKPTRHSIYKSGVGVPLLGGCLRFTGHYNVVSVLVLLLPPSLEGVLVDQRELFGQDWARGPPTTHNSTEFPQTRDLPETRDPPKHEILKPLYSSHSLLPAHHPSPGSKRPHCQSETCRL